VQSRPFVIAQGTFPTPLRLAGVPSAGYKPKSKSGYSDALIRVSNEGRNQVVYLFLEWQNFSVEEYEKTRAQNVPKTKVDSPKLVEIVQHQKKLSGSTNRR
jgi:hypothetical protein